MIHVHAFSPFVYVSSFYLPASSVEGASPSDVCFHIPLGSINSFVTTVATLVCACGSSHSNILAVLSCLHSSSANAYTPVGDIFLPLSVQQQIKEMPHPSIDVIHISQAKLAQLSAHIDPTIKFLKKCNGNNHSQFMPELFHFEDLLSDPSICKRGVVYSPGASIWNTEYTSFYIPESCFFFWGDVRVGLRSLESLNLDSNCEQEGEQPQAIPQSFFCYDTVVLDPPWRNKSARRGSKYQTGFSNAELLALKSSLSAIMNPRGCLLAVWVTNNNTYNFVKDTLLPHWGVQFVAVWWWLKVTKSGKALHEGGHKHGKKTYERVVVGYYGDRVLPLPGAHSLFFLDDYNGESEGATVTNLKRSHEATVSSGETTRSDSSTVQGLKWDPSKSIKIVDSHEYKSQGFTLSLCQNISGESCDKGDEDSNDSSGDSFKFPIHVIASVPIRHSWKPPLQSLLREVLRSIHQYYDLSSSVEDKCLGGLDAKVTAPGSDLELFARWVAAIACLCDVFSYIVSCTYYAFYFIIFLH